MGPVTATKRSRFAKIAEASRENMQVAIDLILVHNQERVKGKQVHVSLNRAMVVTAAGTWERFVADTATAFTLAKQWWTPGRRDSRVADAYGVKAEAVLSNSSATSMFRTHWEAEAGASWAGITISPHETLTAAIPGNYTGLTLTQHLDQWVELRNALAHQQLEHAAHVARNAKRWKSYPRHNNRDDPYATNDGQRLILWESNAQSDTVQAGAARASVALFVQILDYVICDVAIHNGWKPEEFRLPAAWFDAKLPTLYRGLLHSDLHNKTLWGGMRLRRRAV